MAKVNTALALLFASPKRASVARAQGLAAEACVRRFEELGGVEDFAAWDRALRTWKRATTLKLQLTGAQRVRLIAVLFDLGVPRHGAAGSVLRASCRVQALREIVRLVSRKRAANLAIRAELAAICDWRRLLAAVEAHYAEHSAPSFGTSASVCDELRDALVALVAAVRAYFPPSEIRAIVATLEPELGAPTTRHSATEGYRRVALLALFLPECAWPAAARPLAAECLAKWVDRLAPALTHARDWHACALQLIARLARYGDLGDAIWRTHAPAIVAQIRIALDPPAAPRVNASAVRATAKAALALYASLTPERGEAHTLAVCAMLCVALLNGEGEGLAVEMVCGELLRGSMRPFFHPNCKETRVSGRAAFFLSALVAALARRVGEERGRAAVAAARTAARAEGGVELTPRADVDAPSAASDDDGLLSSSLARWAHFPPLAQASLDAMVDCALPLRCVSMYCPLTFCANPALAI